MINWFKRQSRAAPRAVRAPDGTVIYAIGDIALMESDERPEGHPMMAQPALQQGRNLGANLVREQANRSPRPFAYRDKGSMATIGRKAAVADFGRIRFGGFLAWLLWSGVHVFFLIEYENRVLVALRWLWNYVTRNRGTRLITGRADVA